MRLQLTPQQYVTWGSRLVMGLYWRAAWVLVRGDGKWWRS